MATMYGSAEDRDEILPRHAELLEWINGDRPIKVSEQANGRPSCAWAAGPSSGSSRHSVCSR